MIERKESWGHIGYDLKNHMFIVQNDSTLEEQPYSSLPLLLNIDLTFKCNMNCDHCVAKDLEKYLGCAQESDLVIDDSLFKFLNKSPFMVFVITGGEPLLNVMENRLENLILSIKNKGIIIDTNGTIIPSQKMINLFRKKNVMVRVSWDSPNINLELSLRKFSNKLFSNKHDYLERKIQVIEKLIKHKLSTDGLVTIGIVGVVQ